MIKERIILASQSQSRRRALEIVGLSFECIPPFIDEKAIRADDPLQMAILISEAKALKVAEEELGIIIASDSFILLNGHILEKPINLDEAFNMLESLSGNKHTFISGLAVYDSKHKKMRSTVATCDRYFRRISNEEITDYCQRYPVLQFAGAHEADGVARFAERIEGSCITETAIPINELIGFLHQIALERSYVASGKDSPLSV